MKKLRFKKEDVARVLAPLSPGDEIFLVGDQGVYLMSFASPSDGRPLAFADGANPEMDEDWDETKRDLFGGDDGGDPIGTAEQLREILSRAKEALVIELSSTQIAVTHD